MPTDSTVLVVDDDPDVLTALQLLLTQHVAQVYCSDDPEQIPNLIARHAPDVVLLDMNFGPGESLGKEGLNWLERMLRIDPEIVAVMITAHGGVQTAVEAMKKGATDFVVKPWQNEKLVATVNAALTIRMSQREAKTLRAQKKSAMQNLSPAAQPILGTSQALARVLSIVERAAPTDANVLLLGENGTGKELVARELHARSNRRDELFISVDLGAIAESVFESELFGHRRGAFTDAKQDRVGRLVAAAGGTLFLDEIGNLPLHLQAKLLTVLEQRKVTPVGANQTIDIDVWLVAATNLSRTRLGDEQCFRQDLLYRINTVEIHLPALRERQEDVPILVEHYLRVFERKYSKPNKPVADSALRALSQSAWPGNVRALRHAVERAVILSAHDHYELSDFSLPDGDSLDASQPPSGEVGVAPSDPADLSLEHIEKQTIEQALTRYAYNISHAAKALGLTRAALYRRMKKHDL